MIKLTDRLQVLADQIEQNETMADIGTDHGFLPLSLWEKGISPKVIMADVSPGSLDKAKANAADWHPGQPFDFRLGNGIQILGKGEVDDVVIAGMGGLLMIQILKEDLEKTRSFKKLILQPRSGQGKLRYWLLHHQLPIITESLVQEGKYICEVLTIAPGREKKAVSQALWGCGPDAIEYEVPPWIFSAGQLARPFIKKKLAIEERVKAGLLKSQDLDTDKYHLTQQRISYLESLLGGE